MARNVELGGHVVKLARCDAAASAEIFATAVVGFASFAGLAPRHLLHPHPPVSSLRLNLQPRLVQSFFCSPRSLEHPTLFVFLYWHTRATMMDYAPAVATDIRPEDVDLDRQRVRGSDYHARIWPTSFVLCALA